MISNQPHPAYFALAESKGLLHQYNDLPAIVGNSIFNGHGSVVIEYCDPRILADNELLESIVLRLAHRLPEHKSILIRTPGDSKLDKNWFPHISYIRYGGENPKPTIKEMTRAERNDDVPLIRRWLLTALKNAASASGESIKEATLDNQVGKLMTRGDRVSYLLDSDENAIGHLTMFTEATDNVSKERYIDLHDILIEPAAKTRSGMEALTTRAVTFAFSQSLPLIGNVVHSLGASIDRTEMEHGERVLASLHRKAWVMDHRYWYRGINEWKCS